MTTPIKTATNPPRALPTIAIELGSRVTDTATNTKGTATLMMIELNGVSHYVFQPRGLNPDTGKPVESYWVVEERLSGGNRIPMPYIPMEVLGTEVTDDASGFKGTAVAFCLHMNGCVHVSVQPKGKLKNNERIESVDFDIRRLKGRAIKALSKLELEVSKVEKPSPMAVPAFMARKP